MADMRLIVWQWGGRPEGRRRDARHLGDAVVMG